MTAVLEAPVTTHKGHTGASFIRDAVRPLFYTDAYKLGHKDEYEIGTKSGKPGSVTRVYSNFTNRGSRIDGIDHVVHYGLQYACAKYMDKEWEAFFAADVDAVCAEYERRVNSILGPNTIGSNHVRALHAVGYLPLRFCAVPEGTLVPIGVPSFTVENTIDGFFWLTNYVETIISASVWQASVSATKAWYIRQLLNRKALNTGADISMVDWQGHDFSFRGMPGLEAAETSGAAHLLSFKGSDTLSVIDWVDRYYPGSPDSEVILGSVPATEHSVMCTGIANIGEQEMIKALITKLHKSGIVSIVADSFNLWTFIGEYMPALLKEIMERDGKVVVRPDSGDPVLILCGNPDAEPGSIEYKGVVEALYDLGGGTENARGFKELDSHLGVIYGDSITYDRADRITNLLASKGFASTNVVLGLGSYFYQGGGIGSGSSGGTTRDTFGAAMKCTWIKADDEGVNILKDPITANGSKKSATGRLAVLNRYNGSMYLVQKATPEQEAKSLLQPVWENGKFLKFQSFSDVRETLKRSTGIYYRALSKDY